MYHLTILVRSRSNELLSPWDTVLKKPVQSSFIFVRLGQGFFKSDYITRYLHTWVVLRLCIVFTMGEIPRVCSKYRHWYYILLIWCGANVSSIAIELLTTLVRSRSNYLWRTDNANFAHFIIRLDRSWCYYFAHDGQRALIRFARASSHIFDFSCRNKVLIAKLP